MLADFKTLQWSVPTASHFSKSRMDLISSELVNAFSNSVTGNLDKNGYLVNCELPNVNPRILMLPEEILEMKITSSSSRKIKDDSGIMSFLEAVKSPEELTPSETLNWLKLIVEKGYYDETKGLDPAWFALNAKCESHWLGIKVAIQFGQTVTLNFGEDNYTNITGLERDGEGMLTPGEYYFVTSSGEARLSLSYVLEHVVSTPFIW